MGFAKRNKWIKLSNPCEMSTYVKADLLTANKYMVHNVEIVVRFTKASKAFYLLHPAAKAYVVKLFSAAIWVRKIHVTEGTLKAIQASLSKQNAMYVIERTDMRSLTIGPNVQNCSFENIYNNTIPHRITFGLVSNLAFNGSSLHNPYFFGSWGLEVVNIQVDGQTVTGKPLELSFEVPYKYTQALVHLYDAIGQSNTPFTSTIINRNNFPLGYTLFCFNLTDDNSQGEHLVVPKRGSVRIELKFKKALTEALNLVVMGDFDAVLEIDSDFDCIYELGKETS